jgi:hypothetical protein
MDLAIVAQLATTVWIRWVLVYHESHGSISKNQRTTVGIYSFTQRAFDSWQLAKQC